MSLTGDSGRRRRGQTIAAAFHAACFLATMSCLGALVVLVGNVVYEGWSWLNWGFLTSFPSRFASEAGIKSALAGSVWLTALTAIISLPIGVGAAVYLEEYAAASRWKQLVQVNIANLAGVPSIVYGILGLGLFVQSLALGRSIISGALTLSLVVLPIVILATQEALQRPRFDPAWFLCPRCDQMANGALPGATGGDSGDHDRRDHFTVASHWRSGTANRRGSSGVCALCASRAGRPVHGLTHPNIRVGKTPPSRIPPYRSSGNHRIARGPDLHERVGGVFATSIFQPHPLVEFNVVVRSFHSPGQRCGCQQNPLSCEKTRNACQQTRNAGQQCKAP